MGVVETVARGRRIGEANFDFGFNSVRGGH
jgi:hypothetical protein